MRPDWIEQAVTGNNYHEQILIEATQADLTHRASYQITPYIGELDFAYLVENPVPSVAIDYLRLFVNDLHKQVLHEWLMVVQVEKFQPTINVIGLLALFIAKAGFEYPSWIEPIKALMGEEGTALGQRLLDDMALSTRHIKDGKLLLTQTIDNDQYDMQDPEEFVAKKLRQKGITRSTRARLKHITHVWTPDLMDAFYTAVVAERDAERDLVQFLNLPYYAHFFPLDAGTRLLAELLHLASSGQICNSESCLENIRKVQVVLDFRQRMITSIRQGG